MERQIKETFEPFLAESFDRSYGRPEVRSSVEDAGSHKGSALLSAVSRTARGKKTDFPSLRCHQRLPWLIRVMIGCRGHPISPARAKPIEAKALALLCSSILTSAIFPSLILTFCLSTLGPPLQQVAASLIQLLLCDPFFPVVPRRLSPRSFATLYFSLPRFVC